MDFSSVVTKLIITPYHQFTTRGSFSLTPEEHHTLLTTVPLPLHLQLYRFRETLPGEINIQIGRYTRCVPVTIVIDSRHNIRVTVYDILSVTSKTYLEALRLVTYSDPAIAEHAIIQRGEVLEATSLLSLYSNHSSLAALYT